MPAGIHRYLDYLGGDFEVFWPAAATYCTDGRWNLAWSPLRSTHPHQISPHRCRDECVGYTMGLLSCQIKSYSGKRWWVQELPNLVGWLRFKGAFHTIQVMSFQTWKSGENRGFSIHRDQAEIWHDRVYHWFTLARQFMAWVKLSAASLPVLQWLRVAAYGL